MWALWYTKATCRGLPFATLGLSRYFSGSSASPSSQLCSLGVSHSYCFVLGHSCPHLHYLQLIFPFLIFLPTLHVVVSPGTMPHCKSLISSQHASSTCSLFEDIETSVALSLVPHTYVLGERGTFSSLLLPLAGYFSLKKKTTFSFKADAFWLYYILVFKCSLPSTNFPVRFTFIRDFRTCFKIFCTFCFIIVLVNFNVAMSLSQHLASHFLIFKELNCSISVSHS